MTPDRYGEPRPGRDTEPADPGPPDHAATARHHMTHIRRIMEWDQPHPDLSQNPPKTPLTDENPQPHTNPHTPPNTKRHVTKHTNPHHQTTTNQKTHPCHP